MWQDQFHRTAEPRTHVFIVDAAGPAAAQVAATQLFGGEAARARLLAMPERTVRLIPEGEPGPL